MGASATGNNTARLWQRGATRRAILDAARVVAARTGSSDFSLNTVAKEAGFSVTTVFAYFASKDDLFRGVAADDLATLAQQMRDTYMFTPDEQPAAVEAAPAEERVEETVPKIELEAGPDAIVVPETPGENAADETSVVPFAPPQEAKAPAEPPRVDAWLERRLRVFEKSLADVETRLTAVQKETTAATAQVEENTRIFGARLDASEKRLSDLSGDLTTRMAGAEKRLRDAQAELRTSLLNACMRIDQLEAVARSVAAQTGYVPPVEIAPGDGADMMVPVPDVPAEKPLTAAADSYLSAARRAAKTAAALAEIEQAEKKTKLPGWVNRTNTIIAGIVAIFFVLGPMVAYATGENVGRSTPVRIVVPRAALHHKTAQKSAQAAPLDKLAALAVAGNPRAQLLIGLRYLKGDGVAIDKREAAKWILKASAAHDPMAQYWTAELFQHGDGVAPDASEALRWYEAAAGQGNRQAMHDLGVAYAEGLGTQKDYDESARWFAKAAALGLTNSQFNLAVLYERGEGVKQDLAQAYKWYAVAAASGDKESQARVDAIASQMPESRLAAAKAEAAAFRPAAPDPDANTVALPGT